MLDEPTKETIQTAYRRWLASRAFAPRRTQRQMIATIANAFGSDDPHARLLAIEAGTGTGKTVAYLLAALPVARARGWRLIVSTATLALQEQLVGRDLPDLAASSGLGFGFELAKGRGRYLCPLRLRGLLERASAGPSGAPGESADMFAAELAALEGDGGDVPSLTPAQLEALFEAFATHRWDGHRDSWPEALDERAWRPLTTDHRGCSGSRCPEFRQCPYFIARQRIADTEVVVANHDLVLADLALGGGAVLPDPENSLYVFDEAHHLVEKAQQHFALEWRVRGSVAWLDGLNPLLATLQQRLRRPAGLVAPVDAVLSSLQEPLALARAMEAPLLLLDLQPSGDGRRQHRFVDGIVPRELADVADALRESLRGLVAPLDEVQRFVASDEGVEAAGAEGNEQWLGLVGNAQRRLEHGLNVLADFATAATPAPETQAPCARWLALEGAEPRGDLVLRSVPVAIDDVLEGALWSRCQGALLTSATLAALGRFDHLFARAGLPADTQGLRLPSPFDYPRQGRLHVPAMRIDGGARDAHTDEIAEQIPELLEQERATLVLFTSWRQLRTVLGALPRRVERFVLCQGELGRSEILARHKAAIDGGKRSAIFGLNSFAEGIDLPGAYCTHVIICKLPFPVPDDPLFAGTCEWLARNGRDPFDELSVPEASLRMVQACGRLIRSEHDQGVITILDRRLVTRRYGRQILDALPPFTRQIDRLPSG